jgi:AcrR family transcriptional regulator
MKAKKQAFVQDEIIAAAVRLFSEKGFRAVTIDDIASSLGFTKSVIYYYFKSKNQILWEIFTRIYDSYFETIQSTLEKDLPPEAALAEIITKHALSVMERKDWTAIYFRDESELDDRQRRQVTKKKRQYDAMIEEIYEAGVEKGVFRDMPAYIAVTGILGMCNWLHVWYDAKGSMTAAAIAEHYSMLLSSGYRTTST